MKSLKWQAVNGDFIENLIIYLSRKYTSNYNKEKKKSSYWLLSLKNEKVQYYIFPYYNNRQDGNRKLQEANCFIMQKFPWLCRLRAKPLPFNRWNSNFC